eukprot:scaffold13954_cov62-Skeletonema_menzelii.AAC.1
MGWNCWTAAEVQTASNLFIKISSLTGAAGPWEWRCLPNCLLKRGIVTTTECPRSEDMDSQGSGILIHG